LAQQVAAAAQPEEDIFEMVNKYFQDLPDDDEPAAASEQPAATSAASASWGSQTQSLAAPPGEAGLRVEPDGADVPREGGLDVGAARVRNAPSKASYLKPPDLSGIDSNNIETPPRSRASSRRRLDDNNIETPPGSRASSQASTRGRQVARAVLGAGKPTFDYGPAAAATRPARRSGKLSSFKAYDPDAGGVRPMRPGAPSSGPALPARMYA
jgi:hypothetical protein